MILNTNVSADPNPKSEIDSGNATNDKVFLLSVTEAEKYFTTNKERKCALANSDVYPMWWLRTQGTVVSYVKLINIACVNENGLVYSDGAPCDASLGVRPAMWISLK